MEYTVEAVSPTQRKISVTVPARGVNVIIDASVREYGSGLSLDGFRKGKVPSAIVEKRFLQEILTRATDTLVNTEIPHILQKENLRPISRMNFDGQRVSRESDYPFSFSFEVLPEIALPDDLAALSVEVEAPDLAPDEIDAIITRMRKSAATLETVSEDRTAAWQDVVKIDVNGAVDGVEVPGMKVQNYMLQLQEPKDGAKTPEIDAIVLTLKAGQEGNGVMPVSDDHPDPALRGKEAAFSVKLHSIHKEVLPDFDDELAKKFGFDDKDALRQVILEQAMNSKLKEVKAKGQNKLLAGVVDSLDYPLPESLVSMHLNEYLAEARNYLMRQGADSASIGASLERMREEGMVQARSQAKFQAFLMALALREGVVVTDEDVNRQILQVAMQTKQEYQKLLETMYQNGLVEELRERLLASKALDFMYAKAKKIVVGPDGQPLPPPVRTPEEGLPADGGSDGGPERGEA